MDFGVQTFAVYSSTGGCGRTVVAVNLAIALRLARPGCRVCLVDLDLDAGDVEMHLDLPRGAGLLDLMAVGVPEHIDEDFVRSAVRSGPWGINVLTAPPASEPAGAVEHGRLLRVLAILARAHDFVVLDCGRRADESVLTAMTAADRLVLVAGTDLPAAGALRRAAELAGAVGAPAEALTVVVNRRDRHAELAPARVATIAGLPLSVAVPYDRAVVSSVNLGSPVVLSAPDSPAAVALRRLGRQLAGVEPAADMLRAGIDGGNGVLARARAIARRSSGSWNLRAVSASAGIRELVSSLGDSLSVLLGVARPATAAGEEGV